MTEQFPAPQPPSVPEPAVPPVETLPWRRLDPRMLLVHPVLEVIKFLPFVIGVFVLGSSGDDKWWQLLGIAVPIVLGVMRYLTTRYRITPTQVELQRGLISRNVLTARLDRVRAVELTSSLIHRVLGLGKVEIGTASAGAQGDDKFVLDGLPLAQAREMRATLLHRTNAQTPPSTSVGASPYDAPEGPAESDEVLMRLDPGWVRYAPLTSSGNVIAAGLLALLGQFAEQANLLISPERAESLVKGLSIAGVVVVALVAFIVLGAVFSVLGYLVSNWGYTLSRDAQGRSFHIRRGLLTSKETSLERERVRGLEVGEPLGLRIAGAGRLNAVVTGLSRSERSSTQLVPPAPRGVVEGVGAEMLRDETPIQVPLRQHGPAARRRRYIRALIGGFVLPVAVVVLCLLTPVPWWVLVPALVPLAAAVPLAGDRYRRLGHALTEGYLVVRAGGLRGRRDVVQRSGIIGWNIQQSWFQRRVGLVSLVATTAAGQQAYTALDIPEEQAIALADAAVPGLISPFLA